MHDTCPFSFFHQLKERLVNWNNRSKLFLTSCNLSLRPLPKRARTGKYSSARLCLLYATYEQSISRRLPELYSTKSRPTSQKASPSRSMAMGLTCLIWFASICILFVRCRPLTGPSLKHQSPSLRKKYCRHSSLIGICESRSKRKKRSD